jgi:hypothetical protein
MTRAFDKINSLAFRDSISYKEHDREEHLRLIESCAHLYSIKADIFIQ